jgi:hypothetical protein
VIQGAILPASLDAFAQSERGQKITPNLSENMTSPRSGNWEIGDSWKADGRWLSVYRPARYNTDAVHLPSETAIIADIICSIRSGLIEDRGAVERLAAAFPRSQKFTCVTICVACRKQTFS